jgi:hypothetical protein
MSVAERDVAGTPAARSLAVCAARDDNIGGVTRYFFGLAGAGLLASTAYAFTRSNSF